MQPDENGTYFYQTVGVSLRYHVNDCYLATNTRTCSLLPGCFACLFATDDNQHVNYLGRLFSVPREPYTPSSETVDGTPFVYVYGNPSYYLTCAQNEEEEEEDVCEGIVAEIEANSVVLEFRSVSELLRSASVIVEEVLIAVMVAVGVWEFVSIRDMKHIEVEMWKLYKEDQREYREVMNSMREEMEAVDVSVDGQSEGEQSSEEGEGTNQSEERSVGILTH